MMNKPLLEDIQVKVIEVCGEDLAMFVSSLHRVHPEIPPDILLAIGMTVLCGMMHQGKIQLRRPCIYPHKMDVPDETEEDEL